MTRRSKIWLAVAVLFTLVNLAGGVFAAAGGELLHAALHVALTLLGAYVALRIASRRGEGAEISAPPPALTDRLTNIEQSVEAVAIEVERIGEGQRFMTRLFTEQGAARSPGEGVQEPVESEARDAAQQQQQQLRRQ